MEKQEVLKTVSTIVETVSGWDDIKPIEETTDLKLIGIDSLDKIEMVMMIEKEYSISINDETIDDIKTVGDIVNAVIKLHGDATTNSGN